jgi:exonuclease VII small subunit
MKGPIITIAATLAFSDSVFAQPTPELERHVEELDKKMRLIDPAFGKETLAEDLVKRLVQLEQRMDSLLAERQPTPLGAVAPNRSDRR